MSALYHQIFLNSIRHNLDSIRFFCELARTNRSKPSVHRAQLARARHAANEIRETLRILKNN